MVIDESARLPYLCYRCYRCGRLLTRRSILARWEAAEKSGGNSSAAICACGSRHISPSNPTLSEELRMPSIWVLWLTDVVWPWLRGK
jgi:hypothetical protein